MALRGNSGQCSRNRNKVCSVLSGDKTLLPCQVPLSDSVVVVQSPGCVWLFVTPWTTARQAFLSLTISQGLPKFMLIALVIPSSHLIVRHPLLLQPSVFPSIRDFCSELSFLIRWPKYWSFNFNISLSSEYSGLISLKVDCFDLLAVQRTFRHLLQHHSLKASILWRSAFFMVQLLQLYMTTGKTIVLTVGTFVGRVMSLLCNIRSRFVIAFLPRSSRLLISCLQSPSALILEHKRRSVTTSTLSPSFCHAVHGAGCHDLSFF